MYTYYYSCYIYTYLYTLVLTEVALIPCIKLTHTATNVKIAYVRRRKNSEEEEGHESYHETSATERSREKLKNEYH